MRYYFLVLMSVLPLFAMAQLTAPGSNAVRYTVYPLAPGKNDPVFIFCNPSGSQKGNMRAVSPGGTPPLNYSW